MKLTKWGNLAFLVILNQKFDNIEAVAYSDRNGNILAVKPGDIGLYETFGEEKEMKAGPKIELVEKNLIDFYKEKIGKGNPGSAIALYDILKPEFREEIMGSIYLNDDGDMDECDQWDMSDFFCYMYERGRGDVAESIGAR